MPVQVRKEEAEISARVCQAGPQPPRIVGVQWVSHQSAKRGRNEGFLGEVGESANWWGDSGC